MTLSIDLEIEAEVLTSGGVAEIVTAILECLLYQRNQIELVYSTFRRFVNEWPTSGTVPGTSTSESLHSYMLDREREKAVQTKESISAMCQHITEAFEKHDVKSLRFLLGSTISTPKEVYTVHLPTSLSLHFNNHHRLPKTHLNQLLISLVTHKDLNAIFSKNLCPTNTFLEFETLQTANNSSAKPPLNVFPTLEKTKLPKSCKDIHFRLLHKKPAGFKFTELNCCRKLQIFESRNFTNENETNDCCENPLMMGTTWWESEIFVRGFKGKLIKGRSIWNNSS